MVTLCTTGLCTTLCNFTQLIPPGKYVARCVTYAIAPNIHAKLRTNHQHLHLNYKTSAPVHDTQIIHTITSTKYLKILKVQLTSTCTYVHTVIQIEIAKLRLISYYLNAINNHFNTTNDSKIIYKRSSKIHLSNYLLTCGIRNRSCKAFSTLHSTISGCH